MKFDQTGEFQRENELGGSTLANILVK